MASKLSSELRSTAGFLIRARGIVTAGVVAFALSGAVEAQQASVADQLVGSWTLATVDKNAGSENPTRARTPRGLLVLDGAGNVFEFFHAPPTRAQDAAAPTGALLTLEEFGGFWGTYTVDAAAGRMSFTAADGVAPLRGLTFSRSFVLEGDRLTVTSTQEPLAQGDSRWVWARFPTVENLSPVYREVVGFWRNDGERSVNLATGEITRESQRGPSVIVYTPSGFVGVHFPPRVREPFAGETPTAQEAQAAMRGYIGYFGSLGVYPGEVSHNILSGISPVTGSILRRFAKITGDELIVQLRAGGAPTSDEAPRQGNATEVILHRLSDADDMLPR